MPESAGTRSEISSGNSSRCEEKKPKHIMPRIKIIVVDHTRSPFLKEGEVFYLDRLRKYIQVEWVEVKPVKISQGGSEQKILAVEGERIIQRLGQRNYSVCLDRSGTQYDSEALAAWLDALLNKGEQWVSFMIGGPLGLSKDILHGSREVISLSQFTLTHEMSRLILLEQLYRAFTILRGEKYHK
jgi:23S rRNA (pseudouridine1915-N3)-methyltransferase